MSPKFSQVLLVWACLLSWHLKDESRESCCRLLAVDCRLLWLITASWARTLNTRYWIHLYFSFTGNFPDLGKFQLEICLFWFALKTLLFVFPFLCDDIGSFFCWQSRGYMREKRDLALLTEEFARKAKTSSKTLLLLRVRQFPRGAALDMALWDFKSSVWL